MPISELLDISIEALQARFGELDFKSGTNEHEFTTATWELPDAQNDILTKYQNVLSNNAVSRCMPENFMPAVKFCSSDSGGSSAMLIPVFRLHSGTYYPLVKGVEIKHKKSSHGISKFRAEANEIYAKFEDSLKKVEKLASSERSHLHLQQVQHPSEIWYSCNGAGREVCCRPALLVRARHLPLHLRDRWLRTEARSEQFLPV